MPQIEVTFDIDANGIVVGQRQGQGHEQGAEDHHPGVGRALSDADIEKMIKEAEENAEADKARRELVEAQEPGARA